MEHESISWIQIPTLDLKRAVNFYRKSFDYAFFEEELNGIPHAVFKEGTNGKKPVVGALIQLPEGTAGGYGPIIFFNATGRFDEILESIAAEGGEVLSPRTLIKKDRHDGFSEIPDTYINGQPGYFAHFLDSEGNRMGLYGQY
jgi:predicted enzyme related to lactoylglutathione lyase